MYTTDQQSITSQPQEVVVENSPKVLAQTLIEVGKIAGTLEHQLDMQRRETHYLHEERRDLNHKLRKVNMIQLETADKLAKRESQLEDKENAFKQYVNAQDYYRHNLKQDIIVRDAIIDKLLDKYKFDISNADKRKIKKLLSNPVQTTESCDKTCTAPLNLKFAQAE